MEDNKKSERARREEEILEFWRDNQIFEKSLTKPSPRGDFVFYEGPPYANGLPGIHHLEARAFKDVILRYRTMRGFRVPRRAGWDTHGLPIEMAVEKKLGLTGKKEIEEKVGIAKFVAAAKADVFFYKTEWEKFTERIGYWLDFENGYMTMSVDYMETVWWIFRQAADRGLLYQDYKVLPWCPRCGTALSSHEVAQGYQAVTEPAVYVKFKVKNPEKHNLPANTFLLAWTTTPWTLPGNVALAVGKEIEYTLVEVAGEHLIVARRLANLAPSDSAQGRVASRGDSPVAAISSRKKNQILVSQLIGLEYEPLFDFPELQNEKSHRVYPADFVSLAEGTGLVHTAVMYGVDDFELGTKIGLPKHHLVGPDGAFTGGTPWADKFVKDAEPEIVADLNRRGLLFKQEQVTHDYPHCWRCQTPLLYYARDSWYLRMSALRDDLLAENQKINWRPVHIKDGRFGEWLGEVKDWAISRERYWGTPLPIWRGEVEGGKLEKEIIVIGSIEELKRYVKKSGNRYFAMRHGEAESNVRQMVNAKDEPALSLTAAGRREARQAAENLKKQKPQLDYLIVSPLLRTRQTAEIVAQVFSLPAERVVIDDRLQEINFGEFHNRSVEDYRRALPTYTERFRRRPAGGESLLDVKRRVGELLYELEKKYQNQTILFITHEYAIWMLAAAVRGADETGVITLRGDRADFIATGEIQLLAFVPLPHNEDYELDLHRPFIDELVLVNDSGQPFKRVPEVLDVWFDSGAVPFASVHYPFDFAQGKPFFGQELQYPADYIAEAIDQTRGWFYTLLAVGVLLGPRLPAGRQGAPYKTALVLGHILDARGKKMSKSLGNVVDPWSALDKYGVDALRFWIYVVNQPGEPKNFDGASVGEVLRKVINPLVNVLSFYELYNQAVRQTAVPAAGGGLLLDQWLLARLGQLTEEVTADLDDYRLTEAARTIREFIADLSQWYVRRSRERFKVGGRTAAATLRLTLKQVAKLLAPFMPFLAEEIYQKIRQPDEPLSVHLTVWPEVKSTRLPDGQEVKSQKSKLLAEMIAVRQIASLGLEARARAGVKVRQPLAKLTVRGTAGDLTDQSLILLKEEVNVKEVVWQIDLPEPVALDTVLTPALLAEGQRRELIRQIQDLRKQAGLTPGEPAVLRVSRAHEARSLIEKESATIARAANLARIEFVDSLDVPLSLSH